MQTGVKGVCVCACVRVRGQGARRRVGTPPFVPLVAMAQVFMSLTS